MSETRQTSYITVFDGTTPHHVLTHRADVTRVVFRITRDNELTVTAPFGATDEQLIAFVTRHIAAFAAKKRVRSKNAKLDVARRVVALDGITYVLKPVKTGSSRTERLEFLNGACYAHVAFMTEERIEAVVKKEYLALAKKRLPALVDKWSSFTGVKCAGLQVRWVLGKWGHWQATDRTMLLAAQLVAHDPSVVDYVVLHELAHALHPNHGKQFWQQVRAWYGDVANARLLLKDEDV